MSQFRKWICLSIACLMISASWAFGVTFFDSKTKVNLAYSSDWNVASTQNLTLLKLNHSALPATLTLSSYNFSSIITISDFRNHIQKTNFKGWDLLSERKGTEFENDSARVDASWECINIRNGKELVVQFYYLIAGRKCFVVSLNTDVKTWKAVQPQYRTILNSFWVGEGGRPTVAKPIPEASGWETPGFSVQNRNFVRSVVPAEGSKSIFWKFLVPKSLGKEIGFPQPLFLDSTVVIGYGTFLNGLAPYDGRVKWTQNLKDPILGNPLASGKTLMAVTSSGNENNLVALSVDGGDVMYRKRLKSDIPQFAILGNTVIVATQKDVTGIDRDTGKDKWNIAIPVSFSMPIIGTTGVVLVLDNEKNDLVALQIDTGKELWRKSLADPILIPPSIVQNVLIVTAGDPSRAANFYGFNINNGSLLWTRRLPDSTSLISEICADNSRFYVPAQTTSDPLLGAPGNPGSDDGDFAAQFEILAYDVKTGVKVWEYPMPATHLLLPVRGISSPSKVYFLTTTMDKSSKEVVNLLQLDTDKPRPRFYPMIPFGGNGQPKGFTAFQMLEHRILLQFQDPVLGAILLQ